jgi:hypothetical protein
VCVFPIIAFSGQRYTHSLVDQRRTIQVRQAPEARSCLPTAWAPRKGPGLAVRRAQLDIVTEPSPTESLCRFPPADRRIAGTARAWANCSPVAAQALFCEYFRMARAMGLEPDQPHFCNRLMAHDFRSNCLIIRCLVPSIESPTVLWSRPQSWRHFGGASALPSHGMI